MSEIEKVVLIENAVETLGYFSRQLALQFEAEGVETYFVDYNRLVETVEGLYRFVERGKTVLCTFNFIGISGEEVFIEENGRSIWENYEMPCLNLVVDHPLYYHSKLVNPLPRMKVFCVDREHVTYMKRFYPEVEAAFLPLAGNVILPETLPLAGNAILLETLPMAGNIILPEQAGTFPCGGGCTQTGEKRGEAERQKERLLSYENRPYDLVFTGNYTPVEHLYREIETLEKDYQQFYGEIIEDLIAHPAVSMDTMLEQHIHRELGEVPDRELRGAIAGMVFIDICIRSYFRGELIKMLAESGVKVQVFGANWEKLSCRNPENIVSSGREVDSVSCAKAIGRAKISLNIMPWFKDGAHDRVFTAMLQRAVSLTDDSRYLRETCAEGKELVFFSLEEREKLPELVRGLLANPEKSVEIAENGYRKAADCHTWRQRGEILVREIRKIY